MEQKKEQNPLLIRDEIDEREHRLVHLRKSQDELKYFILIEPEDSDLSTAFYENNLIIARIENEMNQLREQLIEIDPAFSIEKQVTQSLQSVPLTAVSPVRSLESEVRQESREGVYL
jgi:hypothetical protein